MSKQTQAQKEQMKKMIERNKNTQPTAIEDFDVKNLIFDEPMFGQVPNQPIKFHRVNMGYRNPDGTDGELVFELKDYSSFGIQENRDSKTQELQGYSVGITFGEYKQDSTEYDCNVVEVFDSLVSKCKEHLLKPEVYKACKLKELYITDLRNMAPHAQKKDKETDEIIEDSHYSIYPKLMWGKEREIMDEKTGESKVIPAKFKTELWDDDEAQLGNKVLLDPIESIGKRCRIRPFVKVRGVFVGSKIKLQLELYAAGISIQKQEQQSGYKSMFRFSAKPIETKIIADEEPEVKDEEPEVFSVPVRDTGSLVKQVDEDIAVSEDEEDIKPKPKAKGKGKK
jgi:hypothetical protein